MIPRTTGSGIKLLRELIRLSYPMDDGLLILSGKLEKAAFLFLTHFTVVQKLTSFLNYSLIPFIH